MVEKATKEKDMQKAILKIKSKYGKNSIIKGMNLKDGATAQVVGLILLDKGVLRAHQVVHTAHGAGEITSGTFSPTMQQSIAIARVPVGVALGDTVQVAIRDKQLDAKVVKLPFVRNGAVLATV